MRVSIAGCASFMGHCGAQTWRSARRANATTTKSCKLSARYFSCRFVSSSSLLHLFGLTPAPQRHLIDIAISEARRWCLLNHEDYAVPAAIQVSSFFKTFFVCFFNLIDVLAKGSSVGSGCSRTSEHPPFAKLSFAGPGQHRSVFNHLCREFTPIDHSWVFCTKDSTNWRKPRNISQKPIGLSKPYVFRSKQ
jgi:hypothetical protein